jgi:glycosyltransferase involved in cell wall biosynthesis
MIVPLRNTTNVEKARAVYQLPEQVQLVVLPVVEMSRIPFLKRFAFYASILSFSFHLARYLRHSSSEWVVTTDHLPALVASWCGKKVLIEVHDFPTKRNPVWRLLLKRADIVLSTNIWKGKELHTQYKIPRERIFIERNGIDLERFAPSDKTAARRALNLPIDASIALYTGNLYSWKGVETLIEAARLLPEFLVCILGGTVEDQIRLKDGAPSNVRFVPRVPHIEVPLWQAAADILVLPNTAHEEISAHYTSPMKLFEYMTSDRPIIASDLSSIREILPDDAGYFFTPDEPVALAEIIRRIIKNPEDASRRATCARRAVEHHTWSERANRILKRMNADN